MKKFNTFIILFSSIFVCASVFSCSKEKDFYFGVASGHVHFTANNTVIPGDSTLSTYEDYVSGSLNSPIEISFEYDHYEGNEFIQGGEHYYLLLWDGNMIWAGIGNELSFTFKPSCKEEKSAIFTFPDNTQATATIENPVVKWTFGDYFQYAQSQEWRYDGPTFVVKAKSEYYSSRMKCINRGYIFINTVQTNFENALRYNPSTGKWILNYYR